MKYLALNYRFMKTGLCKKNLYFVTSLLLLLLFFVPASAQEKIEEVYPANWWAGMKWNKLQLMLHGKNISRSGAIKSTTNYPGIKIISLQKVENPNYLFLNIEIAPATKTGIASFILKGQNSAPQSFSFEIKQRRTGKGKTYAQGVNASDLIYLIMPDRFSNGDYTNDRIAGMKDQSLNRDSMYHRHGGDIQGVINHLDYLQDLGITALWLMPVLENDRPHRSEHGYAFTNHYKIDPRLGTAITYKKLGEALHQRKMKLIQDAVYNHVGLQHFTVRDKPMKDWLHEWPSFTQTTYKDQVIFDPYASAFDIKKMREGWFEKEMPDLNQENPFVVNYLIQHALWCVEEFGIDGWRIDTYAYNNLEFMNRCNQALYDEYPAITIFGETWVHGVPNQSYFCQNNYNISFKSNLQNTTDFQELFYGIQPALNEKFGWTEGVNKLYTTTSQDFVYKRPSTQVIFLDNHDLSRFYSVVNEDVDKYKMALGWLLTFRGIPQMYYGMEHLMTGYSNPDGKVRMDFKGGWKDDSINKFTAEGRTDKENDVYNYIRRLSSFRKTSLAITTGKLMQYVPDDGLYVYFRYSSGQTIMCIMNTSEHTKQINMDSEYIECTKGFSKAINIITGNELPPQFTIEPKKMLILELKK
ncbi:MAG: alpha-amylase family glycosyl hydrolase [Ferruginibacter sp.]